MAVYIGTVGRCSAFEPIAAGCAFASHRPIEGITEYAKPDRTKNAVAMDQVFGHRHNCNVANYLDAAVIWY